MLTDIVNEMPMIGGHSPWDIDWGDEGPIDIITDAAPVRIDGRAEFSAAGAEDDFTDEQWILVNILKRRVREACNVNTQSAKRWKAIEWCFVPGTPEPKHGVEFSDLCMALGARPEVIRARIHHQWYMAGVVLERPLPLMAVKMPEQYESEAIMSAWDGGLLVCQEIWRWPGIPMGVLAKQTEGMLAELQSDFTEVMDRLVASHLVAWRFGCAFLIGRKAHGRRRNFSWSKSFF